MRLTVELEHATDCAGFLRHARALAAAGVPPEAMDWRVADEGGADLFGARPAPAPAAAPPSPAAFDDLAETLALHRDGNRFALAYRLLFRLQRDPRLLSIPTDPDVARAEEMRRTVGRDMHKMKAFVRFRAVAGPGANCKEAFVAWFEPEHRILRAVAPFFVRRFANMRWSILTPEACAHWAAGELHFGPGATRGNAPDGDALEQAWRTYYSAIFNPARVNLKAMAKEMPRKYWRNLPEAELIAPLARSARARSADMIGAASRPARAARDQPAAARPDTAEATLEALAAAERACERCDLYRRATQVVPGVGAPGAALMFVGEQPGDEEDLRGQPFVGPAGRLLDEALKRVGIDRETAFVTNAVKHFKFEPRGKKRIHKKPGAREIAACRGWLEREIELVRPRLIVALGATAASSLLGRATALREVRGRSVELSGGGAMLATVHPSYLLRLIDREDKKREWKAFLADLEQAKALAQA